jgi:hypothetical protein
VNQRTKQPNRPTGFPTPTPYGGASAQLASLEIRRELVAVPVYTWTCRCGKRLRHRDQRTLAHNIEEHQAAQHSEHAERRRELEDVKKKLSRLTGPLNSRYGGLVLE